LVFYKETLAMAKESVHDKLSRVRKPHVHITYKVFDGGLEKLKELPFVMGVVGDFSGNPTEPKDRFADRRFTEIDRDNFDQVMSRIQPELNFRVENLLQNDDTEIPVHLEFNAMEDFEPARVANQVGPLKELLEIREKLRRLQTRVEMDPDLEGQIDQLIGNTELREQLNAQRPSASGGSDANPAETNDNETGDE
jgi:type VI secretion system protein ImpB